LVIGKGRRMTRPVPANEARTGRAPRREPENQDMDREHVKGAADKAKGAVKDAAGKLTGDKSLQAEGKFDKAKGDAHNLAGDAKDAVRKTTRD